MDAKSRQCFYGHAARTRVVDPGGGEIRDAVVRQGDVTVLPSSRFGGYPVAITLVPLPTFAASTLGQITHLVRRRSCSRSLIVPIPCNLACCPCGLYGDRLDIPFQSWSPRLNSSRPYKHRRRSNIDATYELVRPKTDGLVLLDQGLVACIDAITMAIEHFVATTMVDWSPAGVETSSCIRQVNQHQDASGRRPRIMLRLVTRRHNENNRLES